MNKLSSHEILMIFFGEVKEENFLFSHFDFFTENFLYSENKIFLFFFRRYQNELAIMKLEMEHNRKSLLNKLCSEEKWYQGNYRPSTLQ